MLIMPVANGVLPRANGGMINGAFVKEQGGRLIEAAGIGKDFLICPWLVDTESLYPVGVIARAIELAEETVPYGNKLESVLYVKLEGRGYAKWFRPYLNDGLLSASFIEQMDFRYLRKEYPVILGAGWVAEGGTTEFRDKTDIPVVLYGKDLESGMSINITGNLGGLVNLEQAHTIEHAIIRALRTYGLCTAKTLTEAMAREGKDLQRSIETSIKFTLPEALGLTATGACGNPMTNLAQIYLANDLMDNLSAGRSLTESFYNARRKAMSQLSDEIGLTMNPGFRAAQGMKKGMRHDDTKLGLELAKKVINRFPLSPWG